MSKTHVRKFNVTVLEFLRVVPQMVPALMLMCPLFLAKGKAIERCDMNMISEKRVRVKKACLVGDQMNTAVPAII